MCRVHRWYKVIRSTRPPPISIELIATELINFLDLELIWFRSFMLVQWQGWVMAIEGDSFIRSTEPWGTNLRFSQFQMSIINPSGHWIIVGRFWIHLLRPPPVSCTWCYSPSASPPWLPRLHTKHPIFSNQSTPCSTF